MILVGPLQSILRDRLIFTFSSGSSSTFFPLNLEPKIMPSSFSAMILEFIKLLFFLLSKILLVTSYSVEWTLEGWESGKDSLKELLTFISRESSSFPWNMKEVMINNYFFKLWRRHKIINHHCWRIDPECLTFHQPFLKSTTLDLG